MEDFHVAMVGRGISRLTCAAYLSRLESKLTRSVPKFGEVGAGVNLGPNALRAGLGEIGLRKL
ncbi:hypothetical protein HD554DRAFT_414259 [Boletus coccyginus]|nr:hypothetical protein HD554DRAFT_414259 [Boletus coccyginus]